MVSDRTPKKRAVNVFVDAELIDEARRLRINLSETLERRLRAILKVEHERRWREENRAAIESINSFIEANGLLANRLRYRAERQ
jgi:antitoxin CcdA